VSLFWADWLRAAAAGASRGPGKARSVILIFNCGAPSHLDLWNPKPDAPESVRGPIRPVATAVPGVRVSELLPQLARRASLYAIVRTVNHRHSGPNSGMYWSVVGRPYPTDSTLINPGHADYPSFGTLTSRGAAASGPSAATATRG